MQYITFVRPTVFSHLVIIARRDHLIYGGTMGIDILEIFKGARARSTKAKESKTSFHNLWKTFQSSTMVQRRRRRRSGGGRKEEERRRKKRMERWGKGRREEEIMMLLRGGNVCISDMELNSYKVRSIERSPPTPGSEVQQYRHHRISFCHCSRIASLTLRP